MTASTRRSRCDPSGKTETRMPTNGCSCERKTFKFKIHFSIICETFLCYALGSDSDINSGVPGQIHDSNCRGKKNDFLWYCQSTWPWADPPSPPLSGRVPQTCPIAPAKKSLMSTTRFYFLWDNCNQPLSVRQREVLGVPANLFVHVFISNLSERL